MAGRPAGVDVQGQRGRFVAVVRQSMKTGSARKYVTNAWAKEMGNGGSKPRWRWRWRQRFWFGVRDTTETEMMSRERPTAQAAAPLSGAQPATYNLYIRTAISSHPREPNVELTESLASRL